MNNKKSIIALLLVAIVGIVGLTIAYFANTATIENEFNTNPYGTTVDEVFTSPDNWLPGTTTPKTLTVTNSGQVDEAVRVSYTESWTSKSAKDNNEEGDLSLTQNNNRAAIINLSNNGEWQEVTENNNTYYYYKYKLAPNETTSTLLDSVTFNSAITNDSTCTSSNNGQTVTCTSTGNSYDGATYKLTFHIETVQYDKYNEAWNLNNSVTILESKPVPASEYLANNATNPANTEYNATTKGKMFQFTHTLNESTENEKTVTELRYIGNEPNNYVYFNCDEPQEGVEYNYATSCEVWRILGVFGVDDGNGNVEQRMKLVRGQLLKEDYWNTARNSDSGYNDWTNDNATLKLFLNGDYYNGLVENGLKKSARNMIGDTLYHLGAFALSDSLTTEQLYINERGNTSCGFDHSDASKTVWTGKVALMYPSDEYMVYKGVNTECYNTPANSSNCTSTNAQTGW